MVVDPMAKSKHTYQKVSKTWWGQAFLEALHTTDDENRLARGRSYFTGNRIKKFTVDSTGVVQAQVLGNINPYFGVYREPTYRVSLELEIIGSDMWPQIIETIAKRPSALTQLLMKEMPSNIEDCFEYFSYNLIPKTYHELTTSCTCADWGDPCKHVAAICYQIAARLDQDPFLLFELRGCSRHDMWEQLGKTSLGKFLIQELKVDGGKPQPDSSYYPRPVVQDWDGHPSVRQFWHGTAACPPLVERGTPPITALNLKKQGDYPAFWPKSYSFVEAMEEFYDRIKSKNPEIF